MASEDQKIDELKAMFNQWKKEEKDEQQVDRSYHLFLCLHKRPIKVDKVLVSACIAGLFAVFYNYIMTSRFLLCDSL